MSSFRSSAHRLAAVAEERGLTILVEHGTEARYCTSATRPDVIYRVTAYSCSCKGFVTHGRCSHHSRLMDYMGWLPDTDPEPDPVIPALAVPSPGVAEDCPLCDGTGRQPGHSLHADIRRCPVCDGTGMVETPVITLADLVGSDTVTAHLDQDDHRGSLAA